MCMLERRSETKEHCFSYRVTASAGFVIYTCGEKMLAHTCSLYYENLSAHCSLFKMLH